MKGIDDFFKKNLINFNTSMYPDGKLTALRNGLKSYYETYRITTNGFYRYVEKTDSEIILTEIKGHDFLIKYFTSITFIHLFFEHLLIEILEKKNPALSKLSVKKEIDLIKILANKISDIETSNKNNISFSEALDRVTKLISYHDKLPDIFQIDTKYHFLANNIQTLKHLASFRNDIIHGGKLVLNRYMYEFFFVNKLLPLIRKYLKTEDSITYIERNLFCSKNVIDEILKYTLPVKYNELSNFNNISKKLNGINHFKELGRASYHNPLLMFEDIKNEKDKKILDESYNEIKRNEANLYAEFREQKLGHCKAYTCPCCGTKSLTTFKYWRNFKDNKTRVETAECPICTYRINFNIGEPKEFNIMQEELFTIIENDITRKHS